MFILDIFYFYRDESIPMVQSRQFTLTGDRRRDTLVADSGSKTKLETSLLTRNVESFMIALQRESEQTIHSSFGTLMLIKQKLEIQTLFTETKVSGCNSLKMLPQ